MAPTSPEAGISVSPQVRDSRTASWMNAYCSWLGHREGYWHNLHVPLLCNEHVKTFSTACFTLLGCYWLRQKFFSLPSDVDSKLYLSNACNCMLTGDWTIFMRCLLILVTVAGMSTTSSWAACSRAVSMAISVPVLPTPALQRDRHRLDEPFMSRSWIQPTHTIHKDWAHHTSTPAHMQ